MVADVLPTGTFRLVFFEDAAFAVAFSLGFIFYFLYDPGAAIRGAILTPV
jgi:hypothetical protein